MNAITTEQAERLDAIYAHRNELTHELIKDIVDPDLDIDLFIDAVSILKSITAFWTSVEAGYGTFEDYGDLDLEEVVPLLLMVLQQCLDAYVDGLGTTGAR